MLVTANDYYLPDEVYKMTNVKKLSKSAIALLIAAIFLVTMLPSMFGSMNAVAKNPDGRNRIGCWWWYFEDTGNETTRENYLTLMEQTGVTEVYIEAYTQLWSTGSQASLHRFVEAAMKHGIRTSVMMDDSALATSQSSSYSYIQKLYKGWVSYKQTYPDDWLYGLHFDVEAGNYTTTGLQNYCDYLVKNVETQLIANGVYVEFDVNPAWKGASGVKYTTASGESVTGFYNVLASVMANGKGCLSLMSYRTTAAKVMSRANEGGAVNAAKKYNCDYMYGIETDNVESGVDIHNKDKAYLCSMLDEIFATIDKEAGTMNAGVAIHHARCYYQLAGTLPTTKTYVPGGSPTTQPSIKTTASSAPTTKPTQPSTPIPTTPSTPTASQPKTLQKVTLFDGDVNFSVAINNYIGAVDDVTIAAAVRNDIAANGTIEGDEYYEIITTGSMKGDSGYAVAGFLTGDFEFWGNSKAPGCSTIGTSVGTTKQICAAGDTDKKGNLLAPDMSSGATKLAYFSDADGYTDTVTASHVTIYVYRYGGTGPVPTQPSQSQSTPSQSTPSKTTPSQSTPSKSTPVIEVLYGDANDDGEINMKDILALRKFIAGLSDHINKAAADVTGDSVINMKDVLLIRKFVANVVGEDALHP